MKDYTQAAPHARHTNNHAHETPTRWIGQDTISGYLTYEIYQQRVSLQLKATKHAGTDRQRTVLGAMGAHADDIGICKVPQLTLAKDLNLDRRDIRNCQEALRETGLILLVREGSRGRASHYLVLPDFVAELKNRPQPVGQPVGQGVGQGVGHARHIREKESESPPPAENRKQQGKSDLTPAGQEVMKELLDRADYTKSANYDAVRATKRRNYLPIVKAWELEQPQSNPVDWCLQRQQGKPTSKPTQQLPTPPQADPSCPHGCEGRGLYVWRDPQTQTNTSRWCVCTKKDNSITAKELPETPQADPAKHLRAV